MGFYTHGGDRHRTREASSPRKGGREKEGEEEESAHKQINTPLFFCAPSDKWEAPRTDARRRWRCSRDGRRDFVAIMVLKFIQLPPSPPLPSTPPPPPRVISLIAPPVDRRMMEIGESELREKERERRRGAQVPLERLFGSEALDSWRAKPIAHARRTSDALSPLVRCQDLLGVPTSFLYSLRQGAFGQNIRCATTQELNEICDAHLFSNTRMC